MYDVSYFYRWFLSYGNPGVDVVRLKWNGRPGRRPGRAIHPATAPRGIRQSVSGANGYGAIFVLRLLRKIRLVMGRGFTRVETSSFMPLLLFHPGPVRQDSAEGQLSQ